MNKNLLFPGHFITRLVLIFVLGGLACATGIRAAFADAAPPADPTVGGAEPYRPQKTKVQMLSETVLIDVPPYVSEESIQLISVSASFTMQNQGQTEEKMQVIFPLTFLQYWQTDGPAYRIDRSTFVVWVDGRQVPTTEITTPAEKDDQSKFDSNDELIRGFLDDVDWAAFDVTFPVHQNVSLRVAYKMEADPENDFTGIDYILETGAGWYGRILSADITLHLPYAATEELVQYAYPGYAFSGNELKWKLSNFEPTRKDNFGIKIISPGIWQTLLDLCSRVEQNPDDAEAWYELGVEYGRLATNFPIADSGLLLPKPRHFADLSIESYEKAIDLRPDWGEAHYGLARILWISNPMVETGNKLKGGIPATDPSIQRVVRELKLAWSYGVRGMPDGYEGFSLEYELNFYIPDLKLTPPATYTLTPKSATQTSTFTPTAFVAPSSTPQPSATPTPASPEPSTSTAVGGLVVGLLIVVGVLVYSRRSKFGDRR